MPAVSSDELYQIVTELLPEGTERLSRVGAVRPLHVRLPDDEEARLYLWTLTRSGAGTGRPSHEHKMQLKLPGQAQTERGSIESREGCRPVILGYSPDLDVFVLFETRHYADFAFNRNVQIPHGVVERARDESWAVAPIRRLQTGSEVRVACARERFYQLVDASLDADNADLTGEERSHFMVQRGSSSEHRQEYSWSASREGNAAMRSSTAEVVSSVTPGRDTASTSGRDGGGPNLSIRPRVGMYSAFARLNYKPWFAIAEFVDNAVQSFLANRERIIGVDGDRRPLKIEVRIHDGLVRVSDGAAGIARSEMPRAFSPAQPPPNSTGLSEFGIGMKAAACWFADLWTVRTSALGERVERTVTFDVPQIVEEGIETLRVEERPAAQSDHYTVLELRKLRVQPKTRTVGKIKDHLASIYRTFIRRGDIELRFVTTSTSEVLQVHTPELLKAPFYKDPDGELHEWRKPLHVDFGDGRCVAGWAGLLAKGNTSRAGFGVLRRDRLIQGSADETWRPRRIFKSPNKYTYQRLVGELYVDGFSVSHTKDGIQWGGVEDELLERLLEQLDAQPLPLISQAEGYRVRQKASTLRPGFGQNALDTAGTALTRNAEPIMEQQVGEEVPAEEPTPLPTNEAVHDVLSHRTIELSPAGDDRTWAVTVEIVRDRKDDWYTVEPPRALDGNNDRWGIQIRLNLDHPFSEQFVNEDEAILTPLVRIVAGLALAEATARESGIKFAGRIRAHFNHLLRGALSDSIEEGQS